MRYRELIICVLAVASTAVVAQRLPSSQWRGSNRDGVYEEKGLQKEWSQSGPQLLWETLEVGKGYSSPVIVGERLYVTGLNADENREVFAAFSIADGKKLYETEFGSPWSGSYPETRTTPSIIDGKAYMISGSGEIVCITAADGKILWTVDGGNKFARKTGNWGTSECPLVFDNKVIYTPSGDKTTMVALDASTGETVWESPSLGDVGAYVSPLLITYNGKRQIVGITGVNVIGVNPETGAIEWKFDDWKEPPREQRRPPQGGGQGRPPRGPQGKIAPNTPLYKDGYVFFSQGYNTGSFMLKLNDDLKGVTLAWKNDTLDTHIGGYVLIDNVIYGSNWINNGQGNWVALDWTTGKTLYDNTWAGGSSKGSVIAADGMLYCYDEKRGMVGLVKPLKDRFEVVSQFRIEKGEGPHWAHPVVSNGVLFIRHGSALMAYKI
jgi:outer membrane protein assembly factor BamB